MSLYAWYPFTSDKYDNGISGNVAGLTFTNENILSSETYNIESEAGILSPRCLVSVGRQDLEIPQSVYDVYTVSNTEISYALWVKIDKESLNSKISSMDFSSKKQIYNKIIGFDWGTTSNGLGIHLRTNSGLTNATVLNTIKVRGWLRNGSVTNGSDDVEINLDEWYHLTVTYDKNNLFKFYINGILISSKTITRAPLNTSISSKTVNLNYPTSYLTSSDAANVYSIELLEYFQDVRIYTHALSTKEVEEIAMGLNRHFKMDHIINSNLLPDTNVSGLTAVNGDYNRYYEQSGSGTYTITWETIDDIPPVPGLIYQARYNISTVSGSHYVTWYSGGLIPVTIGKTYTMSCYAKRIQGINIQIAFQYGKNPYRSYSTVMLNDNEWHQYSWTFTPDDQAAANNSTRIYCGGIQSVGEVLICGWKLEEGDAATQWCEWKENFSADWDNLSLNQASNSCEADCSGLETVGTIYLPESVKSLNFITQDYGIGRICRVFEVLDYLESTGTQYIDTGRVPKTNGDIECIYMLREFNGYRGPFGAYTAEADNTTRLIPNNGSNSNIIINFDSKAGGGGYAINNVTSGVDQVVQVQLFSNGYYIENTTTGNTFYGSNISYPAQGNALTGTMLLFASSINARSKTRIYYFYMGRPIKSFTSEALKLYPARMNGTLGMLDIVSGKFFTNAGTGTFIAGPVQRNAEMPPTVSASSNTPRYKTSTYFPGANVMKFHMSRATKTISLWVNFDDTSGSSYRIVLHDKGSGLAIGYYSNKIITYIGSSAGGTGSCVTANLSANTWYHIVVVKTGTTTRDTYINGIKATATSNNWWGGGDNYNCIVGGRYINNVFKDFFTGRISDIRTYSTQLTQKQILELYNASATIDNAGNIYARELVEI